MLSYIRDRFSAEVLIEIKKKLTDSFHCTCADRKAWNLLRVLDTNRRHRLRRRLRSGTGGSNLPRLRPPPPSLAAAGGRSRAKPRRRRRRRGRLLERAAVQVPWRGGSSASRRGGEIPRGGAARAAARHRASLRVVAVGLEAGAAEARRRCWPLRARTSGPDLGPGGPIWRGAARHGRRGAAVAQLH